MTERRASYRVTVKEHDIQAAVIHWSKLAQGRYPELALLFSVPNGFPLPGLSKDARARIINHMKAEGLHNGVPDLWLPVGRGGYGFLAIEMKRPDGETSKDQDEYIKLLDKLGGGFVTVCRDYDDAIQTIEWYLDGAK